MNRREMAESTPAVEQGIKVFLDITIIGKTANGEVIKLARLVPET